MGENIVKIRHHSNFYRDKTDKSDHAVINKPSGSYLIIPSVSHQDYTYFQPVTIGTVKIIPSLLFLLLQLLMVRLSWYLTLDMGATCSVMSLRMATKFCLTITKTHCKAIQVDGKFCHIYSFLYVSLSTRTKLSPCKFLGQTWGK